MSSKFLSYLLSCAAFVWSTACTLVASPGEAAAATPTGPATLGPALQEAASLGKEKDTATEGVPSIRLVRKVKTGSLPKAVAVSPDGSRLFVTNFGRIKRWNMFMFDAVTLERTATIDFDGNGVEMAFVPGGGRLLVSNFRGHKVNEIDVATLRVVRSYKVGKNPKTIAISTDGRRAYVSNWSSDDVTVIDLVAGKVVGKVVVGNQPRGIAVAPDGHTLFVSTHTEGSLVRVETAGMKVTGRLNLSKRKSAKLRHVALSPDGQRVYVTSQKFGVLFVVDAATMVLIGRVKTGAGPKTVDVTVDGRFAFTADYSAHSVTAVNLATLDSKTFPTPFLRRPCGLDLSPDGSKLYVTGWEASLLAEFAVTYPK